MPAYSGLRGRTQCRSHVCACLRPGGASLALQKSDCSGLRTLRASDLGQSSADSTQQARFGAPGEHLSAVRSFLGGTDKQGCQVLSQHPVHSRCSHPTSPLIAGQGHGSSWAPGPFFVAAAAAVRSQAAPRQQVPPWRAAPAWAKVGWRVAQGPQLGAGWQSPPPPPRAAAAGGRGAAGAPCAPAVVLRGPAAHSAGPSVPCVPRVLGASHRSRHSSNVFSASAVLDTSTRGAACTSVWRLTGSGGEP